MDDLGMVDELGSVLAEAKATATEGRREEAHRLLSQIAEQRPQNVEAWLWLAATAATREDELAALNTALQLHPDYEHARLAMYEALKRQLEHDAFLAYDGESESVYWVHTADGHRVVVPKRRAAPKPYPPPEPGSLKPASRWLLLAVVGLLPSGLGALFAAPIALVSALRLPASDLGAQDRKRRRVLIVAALALWLLGLSLSLLVLIHL